MQQSGLLMVASRLRSPFRLVLIAMLLLESLPGKAQPADFQTWSSISLQKELSPRWNVLVREELRLRDYSTGLRVLFTEVGGRYKIMDRVTAGLHYRLLLRPSGISHRIYEETNFRWRFGKPEAGLRLRLQHEFRPSTDQSYIRTRLSFGYRLNKKFRPNASAELFYHIFAPQEDEFDELRLKAGTDWRINPNQTLSAHLQYEYEFNQVPVFRAICLVVGFDLDL